MTGRREAQKATADAPRAVMALTPDLHRCTPAYWLGRAVGQLVADVATLLDPPRRKAGAATV